MDVFQNRWVDRYLLRYGPATILGAIIISYFYSIRRNYGISIDFPKDRYILSIVFIFGGFLYAYIASAPILVGHCTRMLLHDPKIPKMVTRLWSVGSVVALLGFWLVFSIRFNDYAAGLINAAVYSVWVSVWISALVVYFNRKIAYDFYKTLCEKRTEKNKEIVESYRTLREHGNAFQIMIWEIYLAAAILVSLKVNDASCRDDVFWILGILCALWIGPAAITWTIACRIEGDFVRDSQITN